MADALGDRLQVVRKHFNVNASQMAERVGLSDRKSWERYERGESVPKADVLAQLAQMGIDTNWALTGEGMMLKRTAREAAPGATPAALDADLMGFVLEGVQAVYREEKSRIDPRNAGRLAARIYDDIVAACQGDDDPAARKAALRMALQQLRRDLHTHDVTTDSKRQA